MTAAAPNAKWHGEFKKSSLADRFSQNTIWGEPGGGNARKYLNICDQWAKCRFSLKDEKPATLKGPRVAYISASRAGNICWVAYKVHNYITLYSFGTGVDSTLPPPEQHNNFRAQNHLIISARAPHRQQQRSGDGYARSRGHVATCCDIRNEKFILAQYTVLYLTLKLRQQAHSDCLAMCSSPFQTVLSGSSLLC